MINVNLLPPEIKEEISQAKKNGRAVSYLIKTVFAIFIASSIGIGAHFILEKNLNKISATLAAEEEKVENYGNLEEKAKSISERINTIGAIDKNIAKWSLLTEEIQKIIPKGVYLKEVKIDANQKTRNNLSGNAQSKKEVAALRDAMEKSEKFEYVDIENSVTVIDPKTKSETETFNLSFSLSKGALK